MNLSRGQKLEQAQSLSLRARARTLEQLGAIRLLVGQRVLVQTDLQQYAYKVKIAYLQEEV